MAIFSITDKGVTVDEVMTRWPKSIRVFIDQGMHCVGCPVGGLHSLEEAALAHGIALAKLMAEIAATVNEGPVS